MGKLESGAHTKYKIRYHFVWIVKYRRELLRGKGRTEELVKVMREIGERYGYVIDTVGTDGDHVHVFCGAAPKESPARVANVLKSITARELLRQIPGLRKELWGAEFWGDGYYVGTVGDGVTEESIKRYIENQGKEDKHATFEQMQMFKL
jgi:putative transposase